MVVRYARSEPELGSLGCKQLRGESHNVGRISPRNRRKQIRPISLFNPRGGVTGTGRDLIPNGLLLGRAEISRGTDADVSYGQFPGILRHGVCTSVPTSVDEHQVGRDGRIQALEISVHYGAANCEGPSHQVIPIQLAVPEGSIVGPLGAPLPEMNSMKGIGMSVRLGSSVAFACMNRRRGALRSTYGKKSEFGGADILCSSCPTVRLSPILRKPKVVDPLYTDPFEFGPQLRRLKYAIIRYRKRRAASRNNENVRIV